MYITYLIYGELSPLSISYEIYYLMSNKKRDIYDKTEHTVYEKTD